jgi:hypothetical protein
MSQITGGVHRGHAAGDTNIEKAASQLVSDTKYKVKQRLGDNLNKMAPAALMKAYMEQLSKSPAGPVRALAQKKLTGGSMKENFNIDALASSSVANALFKVFVEGTEKQESVLGEEYLEELMKKNRNGETLYWVKVYYKNGTTYTRWADRARMNEIRSNPNVESVEMVDSKPPENQRDQSSKKDYDGDGKVESGAKEYRGSVHNAIQRNKGGTPDGRDTSSVKEDLDFVEEDFIQEKKNSKKSRKFDVMRGNGNDKRIKLFPETTKVNEEVVAEDAVSVAQQQFMGMVNAFKKGKMKNASPEVKKAAKGMSGTEVKKFASTKHKGLPKHVQKEETACDSSEPQKDARGDYAKTNLIKNKLRSGLGVKNPIVMVSNQDDVKEDLQATVKSTLDKGADFMKTNPVAKAVGAVIDPLGKGKRTVTGAEQKQKIERNVKKEEVEMIDERRREDKGTPRKPRDKAFELVANSMGANRLGVQPRGKRKDRTSPVQAEPPEITPAQKVAKNRASRERGNEFMRDTRGT